jgi:hypothetical protein
VVYITNSYRWIQSRESEHKMHFSCYETFAYISDIECSVYNINLCLGSKVKGCLLVVAVSHLVPGVSPPVIGLYNMLQFMVELLNARSLLNTTVSSIRLYCSHAFTRRYGRKLAIIYHIANLKRMAGRLRRIWDRIKNAAQKIYKGVKSVVKTVLPIAKKLGPLAAAAFGGPGAGIATSKALGVADQLVNGTQGGSSMSWLGG